MSTFRRLAVYAVLFVLFVLFVLGVALYVAMVILGAAFGLSQSTARWLAFGGLAAYSIVVAIILQTRRR